MTRLARVDRQARASALANAIGARNGAVLAEVPPPTDEGQSSAELWLYGVVGGYWWGFNDKTVADQLRGLDVDQITVRLNSPGGDAIQGIAIGNLLRNHKARVTVVVDGLAASSASIIAIAADEVVLSPGSQMMIHDPWLWTAGNAKELRQDADFLDKQGANLASVYALRGGTAEEWRAAMIAEPDGTWYTADEAVSNKLADRIGTVVAIGAAPEPPPVDLDDEDNEMAARAAWDLEVLIAPAARAAWNPRAHKPPTASAGGTTPTEGGSAVAFTTEQMTNLRATLGLPESADEAAVVAAINAVVEESLEERAPATTPQIPDGMALVDSAMLQQLQAGAAAGQTAAATLANQERDREIGAALRDGKIAAASRERFEEQWGKDPAGTKALLDVLTPGLVPVAEIGHGNEPEAATASINDAELAVFAAQLGLSKEDLDG